MVYIFPNKITNIDQILSNINDLPNNNIKLLGDIYKDGELKFYIDGVNVITIDKNKITYNVEKNISDDFKITGNQLLSIEDNKGKLYFTDTFNNLNNYISYDNTDGGNKILFNTATANFSGDIKCSDINLDSITKTNKINVTSNNTSDIIEFKNLSSSGYSTMEFTDDENSSWYIGTGNSQSPLQYRGRNYILTSKPFDIFSEIFNIESNAIINKSSSPTLSFNEDGTTQLKILHNTTDNGNYIQSLNNNPLIFDYNDSEKLRIKNEGVDITGTLNVNENLKIDDSIIETDNDFLIKKAGITNLTLHSNITNGGNDSGNIILLRGGTSTDDYTDIYLKNGPDFTIMSSQLQVDRNLAVFRWNTGDLDLLRHINCVDVNASGNINASGTLSTNTIKYNNSFSLSNNNDVNILSINSEGNTTILNTLFLNTLNVDTALGLPYESILSSMIKNQSITPQKMTDTLNLASKTITLPEGSVTADNLANTLDLSTKTLTLPSDIGNINYFDGEVIYKKQFRVQLLKNNILTADGTNFFKLGLYNYIPKPNPTGFYSIIYCRLHYIQEAMNGVGSDGVTYQLRGLISNDYDPGINDINYWLLDETYGRWNSGGLEGGGGRFTPSSYLNGGLKWNGGNNNFVFLFYGRRQITLRSSPDNNIHDSDNTDLSPQNGWTVDTVNSRPGTLSSDDSLYFNPYATFEIEQIIYSTT